MTNLTLLEMAIKGPRHRHIVQAVAQALLALTEEQLEACPPQRDIAALAGITERSVRRALRQLELVGGVKLELRPNNRRRIHVDRMVLGIAAVD